MAKVKGASLVCRIVVVCAAYNCLCSLICLLLNVTRKYEFVPQVYVWPLDCLFHDIFQVMLSWLFGADKDGLHSSGATFLFIFS